eukprot:gene3359-6651_t
MICTDASSFDYIRLENMVYVDKTEYIYKEFFEEYKKIKYAFLIRPRRFGKSLMCSTIANLFNGRKSEIHFKGLWIQRSGLWDFVERNAPVIHLDMTIAAGGSSNIQRFESKLTVILHTKAEDLGVTNTRNKFRKQVVVIIDEYDKPVLDLMDNPDEMEKVRSCLSDFYAMLKAQEDNIKFVFITGMYRFTQLSMFSSLNNLNDLSLRQHCGSITGYTREEIRTNFPKALNLLANVYEKSIDEILNDMSQAYNGYIFGVNEGTGELSAAILNPFAVNRVLESSTLKTNHWYLSGSAKVLAERMMTENFDFSSKMIIRLGKLEQGYDIKTVPITVLMYFAALKRFLWKRHSSQYLEELINQPAFSDLVSDLKDYLTSNNFFDTAPLVNILCEILGSIPYMIIGNEASFRLPIDTLLKTMFPSVQFEVMNAKGRADAIMYIPDDVHPTRIIIIEYKFTKSGKKYAEQEIVNEGIEQIRNREYYIDSLKHKNANIYGLAICYKTGVNDEEMARKIAIEARMVKGLAGLVSIEK